MVKAIKVLMREDDAQALLMRLNMAAVMADQHAGEKAFLDRLSGSLLDALGKEAPAPFEASGNG